MSARFMIADKNQNGAHLIEISGWDQDGVFFVERLRTGWNYEYGNKSRKKLALRRTVSAEAVVFVRTSSPQSSSGALPKPYRIVSVEPMIHSGQWEFYIMQLRPRKKSTCWQ